MMSAQTTTKTNHYFRVLALVAALALAASLLLAQAERPARAAFPGQNGKIAFVSNRDGNNEIYTMNPDGSGQTNLTNNKAVDRAPAFSPDGKKIAFESSRDGGLQIFVMNADGSDPVNISNNAAVSDFDPVWSPDGKKIAFLRSDSNGNEDILVMDTDPNTIGVTNLTNDALIDNDFPAFSPDGKKIAFESFRDGDGEIFVMNADGTQQTNLSNSSPGEDLTPAFSPDGKKIVFASTRDGKDEIYAMNPDGSSQTRLTNNDAFEDFPAFSPDGKKIAFESDRDGSGEIYAMNPDGTGQTNLTNFGPASDVDPDWGVLAADATAPRVAKVEPAENATGVSPTANASAFFSEAMNPSTINTTTVKLKKAGTSTGVGATVTYDAATRKATLNPNAGLTRGASYVATVSTGAKDLAGNALDQNATTSGSQPKTWKFTIAK